MKFSKNKNKGFSLIELIIALAVLAFLMVAVSSFMGSSVSQSRKTRVDVKLQTQAQETYGLITDSIMQASDIIMMGYTVPIDANVSFTKTEEALGQVATLKCYVKDEATKNAVLANPAAYGIQEVLSPSDVAYFKDVDSDKNLYVTFLRIESSVPLDMNSVPGGNPSVISTQTIMNTLTGVPTVVDCTEQNSKKVYSVNDTLVSTFCFENESMYYGRKYAYMTDLDDELDMTDTDSKTSHLYNKYFSYLTVSGKSVGLSGCVATVNADEGTIGIDLFYNKSEMTYTTLGRINTRNSYVLKPRR